LGGYQTLALSVPSHLGMLIPDLVVTQLPDHSESDTHVPAALAELVVEVTSKSDARHDRISKPAAYAPRESPSTSSSTVGHLADPRRRCTANRRETSTGY
jgi:hypothetical protein